MVELLGLDIKPYDTINKNFTKVPKVFKPTISVIFSPMSPPYQCDFFVGKITHPSYLIVLLKDIRRGNIHNAILFINKKQGSVAAGQPRLSLSDIVLF